MQPAASCITSEHGGAKRQHGPEGPVGSPSKRCQRLCGPGRAAICSGPHPGRRGGGHASRAAMKRVRACPPPPTHNPAPTLHPCGVLCARGLRADDVDGVGIPLLEGHAKQVVGLGGQSRLQLRPGHPCSRHELSSSSLGAGGCLPAAPHLSHPPCHPPASVVLNMRDLVLALVPTAKPVLPSGAAATANRFFRGVAPTLVHVAPPSVVRCQGVWGAAKSVAWQGPLQPADQQRRPEEHRPHAGQRSPGLCFWSRRWGRRWGRPPRRQRCC